MNEFLRLLNEQNISKAAFAAYSGVHVNTVSRWKDNAPKWAILLLEQKAAIDKAEKTKKGLLALADELR